MARTNVGCGGRGGRGLSDHVAARCWGQKVYGLTPLEQVHKRPPTAAEVFELTHAKKGAFIMSKSERVAAAYNGALVDKYGSNPANRLIYDDDLWKQCARDDTKGGVFGWGSMSDPQYMMTGTPSTTRCTGALSSGSKDV